MPAAVEKPLGGGPRNDLNSHRQLHAAGVDCHRLRLLDSRAPASLAQATGETEPPTGSEIYPLTDRKIITAGVVSGAFVSTGIVM
jgi:hypothetical protein